ncbi:MULTISPECIES: hypothetical protein [Bradyrhizobium]|uniref:Uncharacterized protein n=2 Tax=Bradyrhizobium TaxID=374 RepID=A0A0R3MHB1_9BRAD|nr:hypothetical protein CQ10_34470 [Bradyrhizobium valentinum]KRR19655.1 hypothetical protein CQ13_33395 [Bradyrhizobium retamae]
MSMGKVARDGREVLVPLVEMNSRDLPDHDARYLIAVSDADSAPHGVVSDPVLQRRMFEVDYRGDYAAFNSNQSGMGPWEDAANVAIAVCKGRAIIDLRPS